MKLCHVQINIMIMTYILIQKSHTVDLYKNISPCDFVFNVKSFQKPYMYKKNFLAPEIYIVQEKKTPDT